jgi:hypothetical protein
MIEDYPVPVQESVHYAMKAQTGLIGGVGKQDPTVEENIDYRIKALEAELARLRESKKTLGPLLPMRISDIRSAMNY